MAELLATIAIVGLLLTISITFYQGITDDARRDTARLETAQLAQTITARQLMTRSAYRSTEPPPDYRGKVADPWNQPYRIDPDRCRVLSAGPDGVFATPPETGDDLEANWESLASPALRTPSAP